ncbi:hypothetical protein AK812_SmicGene34474 [Symbiodinium microadriaticum]|uniref:WW domain-containing protein n=1 Tax=Symbiodinium microadriaticum TaxID=2951 RepID=A0A1Q9CNX8_SYMMI|nr:hypothetical protein AK812_SmicGene34474 [Symbiodinium microadriaticum]
METWRPWLTWIREQGAEMSAEQLMTSAAAQVGTLSEARFQTDRTIEDLVAARDPSFRMRLQLEKTTVCQPASAVSLNKADNNWTEYAAEDGRIWEHNEVTGESRWKDIEKL